uniref:Putative secreted protein n=1 Tax=Ixodes ricinus TaxID=34613 RepID=A0A6B0UHF6_IXORI
MAWTRSSGPPAQSKRSAILLLWTTTSPPLAPKPLPTSWPFWETRRRMRMSQKRLQQPLSLEQWPHWMCCGATSTAKATLQPRRACRCCRRNSSWQKVRVCACRS